jgi:hypothetical protein
MKIHNFSLKDEQIEVAKFGLEHLVIIMLHLFFLACCGENPKWTWRIMRKLLGYIYMGISRVTILILNHAWNIMVDPSD